MSRDVFSNDHVCYLDDLHKQHKSAALLKAAWLLHHRSAYVVAGRSLDIYTWYYTYDVLGDLARVLAGFENAVKAQLLLDDKVVHEVKRLAGLSERKVPPALTRELLLEATAFEYDPAAGRNVLPGVSKRTLGLQKLLLDAERLNGSDLVQAVQRLQAVRNNLHFAEGDPEEFRGSDIDLLTAWHAEVVVPGLQKLAEDLQAPGYLKAP